MPGVFVVTDSSCDLDQDEIDPFNIEIVPLTIRFGSEEFTDRQDLSVEAFYQRMANTEDLPQTACPSPGAFEQAFHNARDAGAEAVVCLTISSDLSTTFQSALTAAATFERGMVVHVVDSRTVSSGLGTLVLEAARLAGDGSRQSSRWGGRHRHGITSSQRPHPSHARACGFEYFGEPEKGWPNWERDSNGGVTSVNQTSNRS